MSNIILNDLITIVDNYHNRKDLLEKILFSDFIVDFLTELQSTYRCFYFELFNKQEIHIKNLDNRCVVILSNFDLDYYLENDIIFSMNYYVKENDNEIEKIKDSCNIKDLLDVLEELSE